MADEDARDGPAIGVWRYESGFRLGQARGVSGFGHVPQKKHPRNRLVFPRSSDCVFSLSVLECLIALGCALWRISAVDIVEGEVLLSLADIYFW